MLTRRIIACLDCHNGRVVKGVQFADLRDAGDPASVAKTHAEAGADEIVLLDISATQEERSTLLETVRSVARVLHIPFTVGGGVRSVDDAARLYDCGVDKISINSAAVSDPGLITQLASRYGSQAVIIAIDALLSSEGEAMVMIAGGKKSTGLDVIDWARESESRGAGEVLLTSMRKDGTRSGFDCLLTRAVSESVQIPVIASGGAGNEQHFVDVFRHGNADAALAASILHFGTHSILSIKNALKSAGVPVRLPC